MANRLLDTLLAQGWLQVSAELALAVAEPPVAQYSAE